MGGVFIVITTVVSKAKVCKIEQDCTYPCPCKKQGQLCPIVLTEALGCSQCNHIFVIRPDGYTLEQLSSVYPYKQGWYWTGQEWIPIKPLIKASGCVWIVGGLTCLLILILYLTRGFSRLPPPFEMIWIGLGIVFFLALLVWLSNDRRS
jgi:hypothetical protein